MILTVFDGDEITVEHCEQRWRVEQREPGTGVTVTYHDTFEATSPHRAATDDTVLTIADGAVRLRGLGNAMELLFGPEHTYTALIVGTVAFRGTLETLT